MRPAVQVWMPCLLTGYGGWHFDTDPLTALCSFVAAAFLVCLAWQWDRCAWMTLDVKTTPSGPFRFTPDGRMVDDVPSYEWLSAGLERELAPPPKPNDAATSARPRVYRIPDGHGGYAEVRSWQ